MDIGEIARHVGVSRSTVSYALSGKRPVSEETRRRVQAAVESLGYRPNAAARALKEGRTRTIGLVVPPASAHLTHMQMDFVAGVLEAAAAVDLDVLLSPSGPRHEKSFERLVTGRRVDGVMLMEIRLDDLRVERLARSSMPFVTIGRTRYSDDLSWVDVDYAALVERCVQVLADLGHNDVVLLNRSTALVSAGYGPADRASAGFERAIAARALRGSEECCDDDPTAGDKCLSEILQRKPQATAAVTINEAALPGFERALRRAGREVPRDFSIVGVAARLWAESFHPQLTAADVPAAEIASTGVELLLERIADPSAPPRHVLICPPISWRASTGQRSRS